jgi:hypothetical protein
MVTAEYFLVFGFCSVVGFCPIPQTVLRRRRAKTSQRMYFPSKSN